MILLTLRCKRISQDLVVSAMPMRVKNEPSVMLLAEQALKSSLSPVSCADVRQNGPKKKRPRS
eukprot:5377252-Amphidinium_carterae.1